jgi:hypothetical protein
MVQYNNRPHGSLEFEHLETPETGIQKKDAPGDVFCHWTQVVLTMRRNTNYSHEMKSEKVRNTFRNLQKI